MISEHLCSPRNTQKLPESQELNQQGTDNEAAENTPTNTQQATTQQGSVHTRITALILIAILFTTAYYLFITKQEQKQSRPASSPQPELIITLPQE